MNGQEVGRYMLPAIVADDGPGAVERFGKVVERLDSVALPGLKAASQAPSTTR